MKKGKLRIILAFTFAILMLCGTAAPLEARADAPYKTYTVDGYGSVSPTQTAYLPYTTITKIGEETLVGPTDFSLMEDGSLYILDSGNKRVVVSDNEYELVMTFGEGILQGPRGMFVTADKTCYIADRDAKTIWVFNAAGELINSYTKPVEAMYGDGQDFKPLKIVVNSSGTMYIICESNTNGIVEISPVEDGTFLGYFGTNSTDTSIWRIIWRAVLTDAQRAKMQSNIPATPDNMAIDDKGIIYTVTRGEKAESLKRLNIAGVNMIEPESYEDLPAAVAVGNHDNVFVVSQEGYIYEYSNEGNLLFVFGGSDDGDNRIGLSTKVEAIKVGNDDKIYVLDSDKAQIQIYETTEFVDHLHDALNLFSKGRYTESKEPLSRVLEMNNLFDYANMAMGKALYKEENYDEALKYARLSKDLDGYSDSFWEIRNTWLKHHLTAIVLVIAAIVIVIKLIGFLDRKHGVLRGPKAFIGRIKEKKLVKQTGYMFYFMRHPIEACYGVKHYGSVSVLSSNILLAVMILFYIINKYFCGFLMKTVREGSYDIVSDIGMILIALLLVVGCNYLMCTINDGEGRLKEIYCSLIYSFSPFIAFMPVIFLLSHVVTNNEEFFVTFGRLFMFCWIAVLVFISIKEINDYTVKETFKIIFLTLFTILIVCLLAFIIYVLWAQVIDFVQQIPREVVYKFD
ncbi:MAG: YIP1 family protein [Lachnospiraceae bacterium]|nr:YIP1 family protein [Lachnospiraceae bacterium]